jgi:hypothetical protein
MKVHPMQSLGCLTGAVDPKTHHKCWVWAFIDAVANLVDVVVSNHSVLTAWRAVFL